MENKKFISTLKGFKTRFTNTPNEELERKSVMGLVDKQGGKLVCLTLLKSEKQTELLNYLRAMFGMPNAAPTKVTNATKPTEEKAVKPTEVTKPKGRAVKTEDGEIAEVDGKVYEIDDVKKTIKRVYKDFKELKDFDTTELEKGTPMVVYQRYLKDRFDGEDAPIKKGKLHFRDYRISWSIEDGFVIEDIQNRYAVVETPFEGIPTPKQLGDWFETPALKLEGEALKKAIERGNKAMAKQAEERKSKEVDYVAEVEDEVDFKKLRKKALSDIELFRRKAKGFDPEAFQELIPFKRWKRSVRAIIKKWITKSLRYPKMLDELQRITEEETFEVKEVAHRSEFKGAIKPDFNKVGLLYDDEIEVDGKLIPAVPFLQAYLLHREPRCMPQLMKYAEGTITETELLNDPMKKDWKVEYNSKLLKNTAHNARLLTMVFEAIGVTAPQDLLFDADLKVGDKILIYLDGELKTRTISEVEGGITMGKGYALYKTDKWIKKTTNED